MNAWRQASQRPRSRAGWCGLVVIGLAPLTLLQAGAQTVYRCGPAGNSYSHQPCPEGRVVDVNDPRSPAQVKEARDSLREQERWAVRAARERRAEEAAHPPARAAGIGPAQVPRSRADQLPRSERKATKGSAAKRVKSGPEAREGEFVAIVPGSAKKPRDQR
jgi:hypothetical protein